MEFSLTTDARGSIKIMDNEKDLQKGHTSAGEFGGPSTGVGGVVAQAPPTSSSDACELGGVDSLTPQDAIATREDQRELINTGASVAAADAGRSGVSVEGEGRRKSPRVRTRREFRFSSSSSMDNSVEDDEDFPDSDAERHVSGEMRGGLVLGEAVPSPGSPGPGPSGFVADVVRKPETGGKVSRDKDKEESASKVWDPKRIWKPKSAKGVSTEREVGKDSEKKVPMERCEGVKEASQEESMDVTQDEDIIEMDRKVWELDEELLEQYKAEESELNARKTSLGKTSGEMWTYWDKKSIAWQKSEEGMEYRNRIQVVLDEFKAKIARHDIVRRNREELLKKFDRKEKHDKKKVRIEGKEDRESEKKLKQELEKKLKLDESLKVKDRKQEIVPMETDEFSSNWEIDKSLPATSWVDPVVEMVKKDADSPAESMARFPPPLQLSPGAFGTKLNLPATSGDSYLPGTTGDPDLPAAASGPVTENRISKDKSKDVPLGLKVKKITKIDDQFSADMVEKQKKLSKELTKMYETTSALAEYIRSNKNIRQSFKEVCEVLPRDVKKLQKMSKGLMEASEIGMLTIGPGGSIKTEKACCDAACMTSPVLEPYPVQMETDTQTMDICTEALPSASFADAVKGVPKTGKKNIKRVLTYRSQSSEEDEEDLDRSEELLRINIDLLEKNKELKTYIRGMKKMEVFLTDSRAKVEVLKQSRKCDKTKIGYTMEVIDRMERVLKKHVGSSTPVVEPRILRKEEQESIWRTVQGKKRIPKVARQQEFPSLPVVEDLGVKSPGRTPTKEKVTRPRWAFKRPDALMVTATSEAEFREAYNKISMSAPSVTNAIKKIRKTRVGNIVLELQPESNVVEFRRKIFDILDVGTEIRTLQKSFDLEVKEIDPMVSGETVVLRIADHLGIDVEELRLKVMRMTNGGTQVAVVETPTKWIDKCLEDGKVKIGLAVARLFPAPKLVKCFRCHVVGHHSAICTTKLDGSSAIRCRRCGKDGHGIDVCEFSLKCRTCAENGLPDRHMINSMACPAFRSIMNVQKDRLAKSFQTKRVETPVNRKNEIREKEKMVYSQMRAKTSGVRKDSDVKSGVLSPVRTSNSKRKKYLLHEESYSSS